MNVTRISRIALAAMTGVLALAGCGGDDSSNTPDAPHIVDGHNIDTAIDTPSNSCTATSLASDIGLSPSSDPTAGVIWLADVSTDLGGGAASTHFQLEFYPGLQDTLTGPIDLTMGIQANYMTCAACARVLEFDDTGAITKVFFQDGGTLNLTVDPLTEQLTGTVSDLSLVEVTIADDYTSTVVPGGQCLSVGNLTLSADNVAFGWTCDHAKYADGASCDCSCGAHDPDCDTDTNPIEGCTAQQSCISDVCTDSCDVLGGTGCATGTCRFYGDDQDICDTVATDFDAAAIGDACTGSAAFCGIGGSIAEGICDIYQQDDLTCTTVCDSADDCGPNQLCAPILTTKGICVDAAPNDTCADAIPLTIGTGVDGTTGGAANNYDMGLEATTCTGYSQPGQDVVYSVALMAGEAVTVTLSNASADYDGSISLLGPGTAAAVCGAASVTCDAGADAGFAGDDETFDFTATTAGTYFVVVDSFSATNAGTFTLTVTDQ